MTRFMSLMALGLTVVSCLIYSGPSLAAEQPNLIIMGEDADPDAVPRDSRIFGRVLDALSNELSDEGFDVYDETAVTLDDFVQGRIFRTDDEIIDIARSINRPPIDVAVIFTIFASRNSVGYTTKITSRIEGRLLNVRSGQRLGNFEVDFPATRNAPPDCNRDCLLRHVGNLSHTLAHDLGAVLSEKLAHLVDRDHDHDHGEGEDEDDRRDRAHKHGGDGHKHSRLPSAYTLVFNGFNGDDIDEIEDFFVSFSGYEHHRPIRTSARHSEYWYETESGSARLNRNLRQMLDHLDVKGRISFAQNVFKVQKISTQRHR